jgi:mycothiol synthase
MSAKLSYQRHTSPPVPFAEGFSWRDTWPAEPVRELSARCAAHDGWRNRDEALLHGPGWAWLEAEQRAAVLTALVRDLGRVELHVDPAWRGRGWGSWLLNSALLSLRERGAAQVDVWAYGDQSRSVRWLESYGFVSRRLLFSLARPPLGVAEPDLPDGWYVRPFAAADRQAWHQLHVGMQADPRLAWSLEALDRQLACPETPPEEFRLLWQGESLRGYVWLKNASELFLFALDPCCRGLGLGRLLLQHGLRRCPGEVFAFCDDERQAALHLLQTSGFEERGRDRCLRLSL